MEFIKHVKALRAAGLGADWRQARRYLASHLRLFRKRYPVLFGLMVIVCIALLVFGFAAGLSETFKALYAVGLERFFRLTLPEADEV